MGSESEKVAFSLERTYDDRIRTDCRWYRRTLDAHPTERRATFGVNDKPVKLDRDRPLRFRLRGGGVFLRTCVRCLMQDALKIQYVDAPVGVYIADMTGVGTAKYFADDYLDVLDIDPVVAVGIAATEVVLSDLDEGHPDNRENQKVCSEPPQVHNFPFFVGSIVL